MSRSHVPRAFIDANVWFSAARSKTGGSFLIFQIAQAGLISICASQYVLDEAERNLLLKSPNHLPAYYKILRNSVANIIKREAETVDSAGLKNIISLSDIPVILGALECGADYLISLDKKHLANDQIRKISWPFKIMTPGEFLQSLPD